MNHQEEHHGASADLCALAEIMAKLIRGQEEYVGLAQVVVILPWSVAGSLFLKTALPLADLAAEGLSNEP